jgi:iron(II)-dependent oxidoreductase
MKRAEKKVWAGRASALALCIGILSPGSAISQDQGSFTVPDDAAYVPFGQFTMGSGGSPAMAPPLPQGKQTPQERRMKGPTSITAFQDEGPSHIVILDAYYMDIFEVSNKKYAGFMKATGHAAPAYWDDKRVNKPDQPVVGVNWHDAKAFCEWEGKRLPTEAEWEKAAKGPEGLRYPWGNELDPKRSNYGKLQPATTPVASYPEGASPYGIYNMSGNVFEWVADWYDPKYYKASLLLNPSGPDKPVWLGGTGTYVDRLTVGEKRVLRGGSWIAVDSSITTTHRFWNHPLNNSYGIGLGFRCAKTAPIKVQDDLREAYIATFVSMGGLRYDEAQGHIQRALKLDPTNKELGQIRDLIQAHNSTKKAP